MIWTASIFTVVIKLLHLGHLPRIELFARTKNEGWDVWGNEVEGDVVLG